MATATTAALANGRALDKNELHEELESARPRRPDALVPGLREPPRRPDAVALTPRWWPAPGSTPSAATRWARRAARRPRARPFAASSASTDRPGPATSPSGPGSRGPTPAACGTRRRATSPEVRVGTSRGWLLSEDVGALESPPPATGIRLAPARRPLPAEAQPAAARPDPRAAQAAVPGRREPRSGAEGTAALGGGCGGSRQGEGTPRSPLERLGRLPNAGASRSRPGAWRSCAEPPTQHSSSPDLANHRPSPRGRRG